jgi:Ca2+-binding EF-hand superfamily protein
MFGVGALSFGLTVLPALGQEKLQRKPGDMPGPIDSIEDLQDTGRMLFKLADENNDGQISQKEAVDAGNLLVGGFFFRADKNGDGVLSQDEARDAREAFLSSRPWVRYAVGTAKAQLQKDGVTKNQNQNQNVLAALASTFDTNNDKQLQASELRQAVQTAVQGGFAAADTNRDGQLSNAEVNAAIGGVSRQIAQAAFQQADTDNDGQISQAEFEKAIVEPARVAFAVMDLNHDGKISQQEAQTARQMIARKLRQGYVGEAPNSPRNQINAAIGNATQPNSQPAAPAAPR